MSVGCDEGRFIFPEEFRLRTLGEASYDIRSATEEMVTVLHAPNERVELLAAVDRRNAIAPHPRLR